MVLLQVLLSVAMAAPAASDQKKSSAIPDRREFPVNPDVKPCENFYDHVCSKVIDSFQLREDRSSHTFSFSDSAERLLLKKQAYFKKLATSAPKTKRETNLKNYYLACMNAKGRAQGERDEVKHVKSVFAGFKSREDLLNWLEKSYLSYETSPLDWGSISNMDKPLTSDLYMTAELQTLPEKTYYKKEDVMADFRKLAFEFFKTIGDKNPEKRADALLKFESDLAETIPSPEQMRQIVNNRSFIPREKLIADYPELRLAALLKEMPDTIIIRDWMPEAFKRTNDFLAKGELYDIESVWLFHSLSDILDDAYPAYYKQKFAFQQKHFGGPNKRPERQERCTRAAMRTFGKEIDEILLNKIFPNFPREKFIALAEKIRASLLRSLQANTWLTKEAKAEAIQKMTKAKLFLVSPETDKQWDFLPDANYSKTDPIANSKTIDGVHKQKTLKELREDQDPSKWDMSPLTVNAYYDPSYNKFVMPIGILQYPFYDPNLPDDENLAAVGSVIGHELGHGVDDQGSRYDSDGKQRQWMTMKDLGEFSKRTQLLISQFDGAGHNGRLTLGENIGDLVGVTASYSAASQDPAFAKDPERVKAFYRAYARVWCEVKRPKFAETQLKTDPHSLGVARANEQIKQQAPFKAAYQCSDKDAMVLPADKLVHIW